MGRQGWPQPELWEGRGGPSQSHGKARVAATRGDFSQGYGKARWPQPGLWEGRGGPNQCYGKAGVATTKVMGRQPRGATCLEIERSHYVV